MVFGELRALVATLGGETKLPNRTPLGERNQSTLGTKKLALRVGRKVIVKSKSFFAFSKFEIIFIDGLFYRVMGVCIPAGFLAGFWTSWFVCFTV